MHIFSGKRVKSDSVYMIAYSYCSPRPVVSAAVASRFEG